MYQVFSRKYRPKVFSEVVGQDHVVRTLKNAIRLQRVAHAYLFSGPRGTGKTTLARILAKSLNCTDGPNADFDPNDPICLDIDAGRSFDCIEIDGASNNGVEQVRDLREAAKTLPVQSRYKIYIIDEVHMLTQAAFNALLKILEEPPQHVKFIFATTEPHKIPTTVISRCQRFHFKRIPRKLIADHLQKICSYEHIDADRKSLEIIADISEGALRDAEVALDQLISFYGERIDLASVQEMFGIVGLEPLCGILRDIASGQSLEALKKVHMLLESGKDPILLAREFRNLLHHVALFKASITTLKGQLDAEELELIREASNHLSLSLVIDLLEAMDSWENKLRYALHKEVLFEIAILELSQLKEKVELEELLARLSRSEGNLSEEKIFPLPSAKKEDKPIEETSFEAISSLPKEKASESAKSQADNTSLISVADKKEDPREPLPSSDSFAQKWAFVVESFSTSNPAFKEIAKHLHFYELGAEELRINHSMEPTEFVKRIAPFYPSLNLEVKKVFDKKLVFLPLHIKATTALTKSESSSKNKNKGYANNTHEEKKQTDNFSIDESSLKNDPLIKEALELFKGKILRIEKRNKEEGP